MAGWSISIVGPLLATSVAPKLWSHPMRPAAGGAPGLYAQYTWPTPSGTSKDMRVGHTWVTIPKGTDTNGNGVFASSQYWYEAYGAQCPNRSDHGTACNSAGYMGSQVVRDGHGGETVQFIFSCWDADVAHKVSWTTPETCSRFGGEVGRTVANHAPRPLHEWGALARVWCNPAGSAWSNEVVFCDLRASKVNMGTGSHCILPLAVKAGVEYSFRVSLTGTNASGAMWSGVVTDTATGKTTPVGTLFYPHLPNRVGFGEFVTHSDDFLEYFLGGDCDDVVQTQVGITGPYFSAGAVTPTQAFPAYGGGDCNRSDVQGCIPGQGCGRPKVLLRGGAGIVRTSPNAKPLWASP